MIALIWVLIFIVSMYVLIKSAEYFTEASAKLGSIMGVSQFLIGITIVSIGTSLPELLTSLIAVFYKSSEIVIGDVIGSNITNILLVLGVSALFAVNMRVNWRKSISRDSIILVISSFLIAIMLWNGVFARLEALIFIFCYLGYVLYRLKICQRITNGKKLKEKFSWKLPLTIVVSSIFLFFGAKYTVISIIKLANLFNISSAIIALSAVAVGTSLPELMVSINAVRKQNFELALGNVTGSNIFNTFMVMGIPGLMGSLKAPLALIQLSLLFMVGATLLLWFVIAKKRIGVHEGSIMAVSYMIFLAITFFS